MHPIIDSFRPQGNLLQHKVIVITGAGDGIGRTLAINCAKYGATVVLTGRTVSKLEAVYDEIEAAGYPQPAIYPIDFTSNNSEVYKTFANTLDEAFGKVDCLVNNAGILGAQTLVSQYNSQTWEEVMQVNAHAPFLATQALLPLLEQSSHGRILFTSSSVGKKGRAYWGAYAVSKFAIEGFMQTLADELENTSTIRVNAINPGAIKTPMRAKAYPAENPDELKTPEDIMPLYLYLLSDESQAEHGHSFDAQQK